MLSLLFCTLLFFQLQIEAVPPVIKEVAYIKRPLIINGESIDAHVFNVQFDSFLFVEKVNISITNLNGQDLSPFSYSYLKFKGELESIQSVSSLNYFLRSYGQLWQQDEQITLTCSNVPHLTTVTAASTNKPPPQFVLGDSDNALSGFLANLYDIYEYWNQQPLKKQSIIFVALGGSYSNIADLAPEIVAGKCTLQFQGFFNLQAEQVFQSISTANVTFLDPPLCDSSSLIEDIQKYESVTKALLQRKKIDENILSILKGTDSWFGCVSFIERVAGTGNVTYNNQTSYGCNKSPSSFDYFTDPCCSASAPGCCASSEKTFASQRFSKYRSLSLTECSSDGLGIVAGAIDQYLRFDDSQCNMVLYNQLGVLSLSELTNVYSRFVSFFDQCEEILLDGVSCQSDADCYTKCMKDEHDISGTCQLPYASLSSVMAKCISDRGDPKIVNMLNILLQGYDLSSLTSTIDTQLNDNVCAGPSASKFNEGWYQPSSTYIWQAVVNGVNVANTGSYPIPIGSVISQSTYDSGSSLSLVYSKADYDLIGSAYVPCDVSQYTGGPVGSLYDLGCFYLPSSSDSCIVDQVCNWQYSGDCTSQRFGNGYMCGECQGGLCYDRTEPSYCAYSNVLEDVSESDCSNIGGKIWNDIAKPNSSSLCLVYPLGSDLNPTCLNSCFSGPQPVVRSYCYSRSLTSNSSCYSATNGAGYLISIFDDVRDVSSLACVMDNVNSIQCNQYTGFNYGLPYKFLGTGATAPSDERDTAYRMYCARSICYNPDLTPDQCSSVWTEINGVNVTAIIDMNLGNGMGFCRMLIPTNFTLYDFQQSCQSIQVPGGLSNFVAYLGRSNVTGVFETSDHCFSRCDVNPHLSTTECSTLYTCNGQCNNCISAYDGKDGFRQYSVCTTQNMSQCLNDILNGYEAVWDSNYCVYSGLRAIHQCQRHAGDLVSCNGNSSTCATSPLQSYLQCKWGAAKCGSSQACVDQGGYCTDKFELTDLNGQCVMPYNLVNGIPSYKCSLGQKYTKLGCVVPGNEQACLSQGGEWVYPASSKEECLSRSGCCEAGFNCDLYLSNKTLSSCNACRGLYQSLYKYVPGVWQKSSISSLSWQKRQSTNQNQWISSVNLNKLKLWILDAAGKILAYLWLVDVVTEAVENYMACLKNTMFDSLTKVSCYCGMNEKTSCNSIYTSAFQEVLSTDLSCGFQGAIYGPGVILNITNQGFSCSSPNSFTLQGVPATLTDGQTNLTITSSTRGGGGGFYGDPVDIEKRQLPGSGGSTGGSKNKTAVSYTDNFYQLPPIVTLGCYERVKNGFGAVVGQLRGDCVNYTGTLSSPIELCLEIRYDIPWDASNYSVPGVADMYYNSDNNAQYLADSSPVTVKGNFMCFNVIKTTSIYCPVSLVPNYSVLSSRTSSRSCSVTQYLTTDVSNTASVAKSSGSALSFSNFEKQVGAGRPIKSLSIAVLLPYNQGISFDSYIPVSLAINKVNQGAKLLGVAKAYPINGVATFDNVAVNIAQPGYTLKASAYGLGTITSQFFLVQPGGANGLRFVGQPKGFVVGQKVRQAPSVEIIDFYGNRFLQTSAQISVTLLHLPTKQEYAVSGFTPVVTSTGYSVLNGIICDFVGSNFVLKVSSDSLSPAYSRPFNVVPSKGYPIGLQFDTISQASCQTPFSSAVKIYAVDAYGIATGSGSGMVKLSIGNTSRADASLIGDLEQPLIDGVAFFPGLVIDKPGVYFSFLAETDSLVSGVSNNFAVIGPAAFGFLTVPDQIYVNIPFSITVRCIDVLKSPYPYLNEPVTINLRINPTGAQFEGQLTVFAQDGVATFDNLVINADGDGYRFTVLSQSGYLGISNFFSVIDAPQTTDAGVAYRKQTGTQQEFGSLQDGTNDVNAPFLGSLIGAICVGIATLIVFGYRMGRNANSRPRRAPTDKENAATSTTSSNAGSVRQRNLAEEKQK